MHLMVDHSDVVGSSAVGAAPATYIVILHLKPGFNILHKDNCKSRRETFEFSEMVRLLLETTELTVNISSPTGEDKICKCQYIDGLVQHCIDCSL